MASGAQSFYSTPAFELFRRGLTTQTIKKFRGINAFKSFATVTPDEALDCMNVLVPGWGGLSKFRLPVPLSVALNPNPGAGAVQFVDFQQGNGTRQVVAAFPDNSLWYFTWNIAGTALNPGTLIERGANDAPPWSMVEANNILFMANGIRMMKWTGTQFQKWGIAAPVIAPTVGGTAGVTSLNRAANVVTITLAVTQYFQVGDKITVVSIADPTFNGTFAIASIVTPGSVYTYAQAAANAGPVGGSISFQSSSGVITGITASRAGGVAQYGLPAGWPNNLDFTQLPGSFVTISAFADATFNGTFQVLTAAVGSFTVSQPGLPDVAGPLANGTLTFGVTFVTSRTYAYAYQNQTTGHVSNISQTITLLGPLTNRIIPVGFTNSTDPQVNAINLFATLDGGGDLFLDQSGNGSLAPQIYDFRQDGDLTTSIQGPLLNNPPPVGKYLAVGQSRIFIGNVVGGPQTIFYTGYEQILYGRPEESVPPNNAILLKIGAEAVGGVGILPSGVVGFGKTKRMYMLRGNVEDITISAPVQFSAFLQELPWDTGTLCHQSIQPTPFGIMFWATDRTVQLFNPGSILTSSAASLRDISSPVYPILRRATQGSEALASSAYFNWLERDWYGLTFPIDGSLANNYTIFWALNNENELEIFPCSIGMDFMGTLSTSKLQRILAFSSGGIIYNLPVSQDTVNGVAVLNVIPATNKNLGAFWLGGYFGNESPVRSKMFKRGLLISDQGEFQVNRRLVNNRDHTFQNPKIIGPSKVRSDGQFSIGQRAARCSVEIIFPQLDVSCNVQELTVGDIATSDRM